MKISLTPNGYELAKRGTLKVWQTGQRVTMTRARLRSEVRALANRPHPELALASASLVAVDFPDSAACHFEKLRRWQALAPADRLAQVEEILAEIDKAEAEGKDAEAARHAEILRIVAANKTTDPESLRTKGNKTPPRQHLDTDLALAAIRAGAKLLRLNTERGIMYFGKEEHQ